MAAVARSTHRAAVLRLNSPRPTLDRERPGSGTEKGLTDDEPHKYADRGAGIDRDLARAAPIRRTWNSRAQWKKSGHGAEAHRPSSAGELRRAERGRTAAPGDRRGCAGSAGVPIVVARKLDGATTVATTMWIAEPFWIQVFATGGIGGVHRGAGDDISADLQELAQTPVIVVCAGAKGHPRPAGDAGVPETHGVTVVGYGTDDFRPSTAARAGCPSTMRCDTPQRCPISGWQSRRSACRAGSWSLCHPG